MKKLVSLFSICLLSVNVMAALENDINQNWSLKSTNKGECSEKLRVRFDTAFGNPSLILDTGDVLGGRQEIINLADEIEYNMKRVVEKNDNHLNILYFKKHMLSRNYSVRTQRKEFILESPTELMMTEFNKKNKVSNSCLYEVDQPELMSPPESCHLTVNDEMLEGSTCHFSKTENGEVRCDIEGSFKISYSGEISSGHNIYKYFRVLGTGEEKLNNKSYYSVAYEFDRKEIYNDDNFFEFNDRGRENKVFFNPRFSREVGIYLAADENTKIRLKCE